MKFKSIIIILSAVLVLSGCSKKTEYIKNIAANKETSNVKAIKQQSIASEDLDAAKRVVEDYYKYKNEKNLDKSNSKLTESSPSRSGKVTVDYIKLINMVEDNDPKLKEGYIYNGRGTITKAKAENIVIFRVDYDVKYKGNASESNGKHQCWVTLIRNDKNSPWLIDEIGQP